MRFLKRLTILALVVNIIALTLSGCSKGEEKSTIDKNTIEVVDALGRVVTFSKAPEKIISSYYLSTSLLINLGVEEKLVGIEGKAKEREMYKKFSPNLLNLPAVGNSKNINVEECLVLEADLVIIPVRLKEFIPQFEKLKIPVVAINPETLEGFTETIGIISKAVYEEDKGKELIKYYENTINKVKDLTKDIDKKEAVYIAGSDSILKTCTSKMYQNYLIEACGGVNVTSTLTDGYWANISVEELINYNPDKILLVGYASYTVEDVLKDSKLSQITAIKNKEVYMFPSKLEPWDYPTPSSILGMLWLVNNLYPEAYSIDEYKKDASEFFNKFYGVDVSMDEIGL